jgi:hypothetical protein
MTRRRLSTSAAPGRRRRLSGSCCCYPTLTGSNEAWINALAWLVVVAAAPGAIAATVLRNREPDEYEHVGDEPTDMILGQQRLGEAASIDELTPA